MTLQKAFKELAESDGFKEISKQRDAEGVKCRVYLSRFNKGELKTGAMVEILIAHGYEISADRVVKKKKKI